MLLALLIALSLAQAAVTGVVRDPTGAPVAGATVLVRSTAGASHQTITGPDGRFTVAAPEATATIVVRAGGFAEVQRALPAAGDIEIVLSIAALNETVLVTPARTERRLDDVPASVRVLDRDDIRGSPALVADDVLRQLPTFSLFRRTSSLASHPTAQGVSLRGIGPSGVSRTLVLVDGVPFNDPFGGWVYWSRLPMASISRIEVVEGASSSLYGNFAMGGVIHVISHRPARRMVELRTQYGNLTSPKIDLFGSHVWGNLGVAVEGSAFDTDGYPVVIAAERGPSIRSRPSRSRASASGRSTPRPAARMPSREPAIFANGGTTVRRAPSPGRPRPRKATTRRRSPGAAVYGSWWRTRVNCRRGSSPNGTPSTAASLRSLRRPRRAALAGSRSTSVCRRGAPAAWRSGRDSSARGITSRPAPTGAGWKATAART
jgi:outer membrane receptor protein involved in Fe transport